MKFTESVLLLLLDLNALEKDVMYKGMADALGLDFFADAEQPFYTISSDMFVLDITSGGCTLLFVDEALTSRLNHIQIYLNGYFTKPPVFYRLLRFFVRFVTQKPRQLNLSLVSSTEYLAKYKNVCECVFSEVYCIQKQLHEVDEGYNIFTHRKEFTHQMPLLSLPFGEPDENHALFKQGVQICKNLYWHFQPEELTIGLLKLLPPEKYYYDHGNLKAEEGSVYIDGIRNPIASFMFKTGLSLRDSVEYAKELKSKSKANIESMNKPSK